MSKRPEYPCRCGATTWAVRLKVNNGGHQTFPYVCETCGYVSNIFEKKITAQTMPTAQLEIFASATRPMCARCGITGAELHHWAPKALFGGQESERWPTAYLCQACHARWHQIVTPHSGGEA